MMMSSRYIITGMNRKYRREGSVFQTVRGYQRDFPHENDFYNSICIKAEKVFWEQDSVIF